MHGRTMIKIIDRLIKMYLRENYSKSGIGFYLPETYPIQKVLKQGEILS
jgi:hypothetical protein